MSTTKADFLAMLDTLRQRREAKLDELRQQLQTFGVALYESDACLTMIHRSTKGYRWQATFFSREAGITGDTQHDSLDSIHEVICNATLVPPTKVNGKLAPCLEAQRRFEAGRKHEQESPAP